MFDRIMFKQKIVLKNCVVHRSEMVRISPNWSMPLMAFPGLCAGPPLYFVYTSELGPLLTPQCPCCTGSAVR